MGAGDSPFDFKPGTLAEPPYAMKLLRDSGFAAPSGGFGNQFNYFDPARTGAPATPFDGFNSVYPNGRPFLNMYQPDWGMYGPNAIPATFRTGGWPNSDVRETPQKAAWTTIQNPNAAKEDRLRAVEELNKTPGDIPEGYRIDIKQMGSRSMVHLFQKDARGIEHPVLRGINNGDNTYSNQVDRHGRPVDVEGTWWQKDRLQRDYNTAKERGSWNGPVQFAFDSYRSAYKERQGEETQYMSKNGLQVILEDPDVKLADSVRTNMKAVLNNWDKLQDYTEKMGGFPYVPGITSKSFTDGAMARTNALTAAEAALKQAGHPIAEETHPTRRTGGEERRLRQRPERPPRTAPNLEEDQPDHRRTRPQPRVPEQGQTGERRRNAPTRPDRVESAPPLETAAGPRRIDTSKFDIGQPDQRTCGIAALTAALGDFDALQPIMNTNGIGSVRNFMERMKSNDDTLTVPPHYDKRGNYIAGGLQTGLDGLARAARTLGHLQTQTIHEQRGVDIMQQLNDQINAGRGAIAHVKNLGQGNPDYRGTGNGHYIYIAGMTRDGNYIVNDSGHGTQRRNGFSHIYVERPEHVRRMIEQMGDGFTAVWK
jgi:Peptidase_C39 like family